MRPEQEIKPKRIAILGSCVSRDAFSFVPLSQWAVSNFVARTSFISQVSPPLPLPEAFSAPSPFERRCIRSDFLKQAWAILDEEFDYLILDFIDDRFDLDRVGDTYLLGTPFMRASGALVPYPDHCSVARLDDSTTKAWMLSCEVFCRTIVEKIDPAKVILHKAWHASHYATPDGLQPFAGSHALYAEKHNPMLTTYYDHFLQQIPAARVVEVSDDLIVADEAHPWGRQPYHYIPSYYSAFLDILGTVVH